MGARIVVGNTLSVGGASYPVRFLSGPDRGLVDMGLGTLVVVVHTAEGWQLSGDPATPEETAFIEAQPGYGETAVKVTGP